MQITASRIKSVNINNYPNIIVKQVTNRKTHKQTSEPHNTKHKQVIQVNKTKATLQNYNTTTNKEQTHNSNLNTIDK